MRPAFVPIAVMFALILLAAPASAAPSLDDALARYQRGEFLEGAKEARSLGTASGHALAARATLAYATTAVPVADRMPLLRQAETDAQAAVAKDDSLVEGHLQLVVALGQMARIKGPLAAELAGIPGKVHTHIERALALAPHNPWALAASGAWNLEVVRNTRLGSVFMGASRKGGHQAFEAAMRVDPGNVVVRYQYALTLLGFDKADYRRAADQVLEKTLALTPKDAYARLMQNRAARLESLLKQDDDEMLEATLAAFRGEADEPVPPMRADAGTAESSPQ